jgi:peptidyl-prolyl cis-trans isomerase C
MQKIIKRLISEPLIQFLMLGVLLFFLTSYIQKHKDKQSREIIVDNERIGMMVMNYKTQTGELPNKQQLDALIDNYIREEISYREARKMGLDKDDEIIRRRLSQKFDFLQTDLAETPQPSDEHLQQFYKSHLSLFRTEARVSFSHIYFSTDNSTDSIARQRAFNVLHQLKQSNTQHAPEKGDRFPLQYDYTDQAVVDIQQNFGDKQILQELFKAPVNTWFGPVQSGYGWHLVYITKIDNAALVPYPAIKEQVKVQYIDAEKANQNKKVFDKISEKYIINRAYLNSK